MCTVTFFSTNKGFILTSNRDENINRAHAIEPKIYAHDGAAILYPKDPLGKGSWIACSNTYTLCLLNGARKKHKRKKKYRKSRGALLLEFFNYGHVQQFVSFYNFKDIEPFTMVIVKHNALQVYELVWDGIMIDLVKKDINKPHIWSSATLYTEEIIEERKRCFLNFIEQGDITKDAIVRFHKFGTDIDAENNFIMKRSSGVQTLSITQVSSIDNTENDDDFDHEIEMKYIDLRSNKEYMKEL